MLAILSVGTAGAVLAARPAKPVQDPPTLDRPAAVAPSTAAADIDPVVIPNAAAEGPLRQ